MSAISTDWVPTKIATPPTPERNRSREEVFHFTLESYIASYRKRHTAPIEVARRRNGTSDLWFLPRLTSCSRR